jgi:hypothetical protein
MDPHAAWAALLDAYHEREWGRVEELADAILSWLERGGSCTKLTGSGRDPDVVRGFCVHALETALEGVTWTLAD